MRKKGLVIGGTAIGAAALTAVLVLPAVMPRGTDPEAPKGAEVYTETAKEEKEEDPARTDGTVPSSAEEEKDEEKYEGTPLEMEEDKQEMLKQGINQFAFEMYGKLNQGENMFFSPYSICSALSLLNLGAGGATREELETALGIADPEAWNAAMGEYIRKEYSEDTYFLSANALWMQEDAEWAENIEEDVLTPARGCYNAAVEKLDFCGKPEEAITTINAWAKENTKGMIERISAVPLPEDTVMVLMNAVYFEGKWETPFLEDDTYEQTFYGTEGSTETEIMHLTDAECAYIERDGIKGVAIPYKNSTLVMKVFLPMTEALPEDSAISMKSPDIEGLFGALDNEEKQALLDALDTAEKTELKMLALPKFTMEYEVGSFKEILTAMGIKSVFTREADLSGLGEGLYVSAAVHRAKIEVDENGARASAVTAFDVAGVALEEEPPKTFIADRPFLYVIQDTETGIVLFMGRMNTAE